MADIKEFSLPDSLVKTLQEEKDSDSAIRVVDGLAEAANSFVQQSDTSTTVKLIASAVSEILPLIVGALKGLINPEDIKLSDLFVKSPSEQLEEMGINQDEIDQILQPAARGLLTAAPTHKPVDISELQDEIAYPDHPTDKEILNIFNTRAVETAKLPANVDVNLNVPYIHQLWDTPNDFHGSWACGPTSVAMLLAYYGLIESKPIEVQATSKTPQHTSNYGFYVAKPFDYNGHVFKISSPTKTGKGAGLYGAIVDRIGNGWGAHVYDSPNGKGILSVLQKFFKGTGNSADFFSRPRRSEGSRYMDKATAESRMKNSLDQGHPLIVSGFFQDTYDHLIIVRGYYRNDNGELMWIVNDPYGFETDKSYDGGNVAYEFFEINPKYVIQVEGSFVPQA